MNAAMDLSFPGQRTATATSVSLTIVYTCQDTFLESLKMAFFVVMLDSKICEAEVKLTPLVSKICKPCLSLNIGILTLLIRGSA